VVDLAVLGLRLDSVTLKVSSNLNDTMILLYYQAGHMVVLFFSKRKKNGSL